MGYGGGGSDPGKYPSEDQGPGWLNDHAGWLVAGTIVIIVVVVIVFLVDPEF